MELFPDAKFIFLWRQPLAVAASMIEAFGDGRWNLERYAVDLWDGVENWPPPTGPTTPGGCRCDLRMWSPTPRPS
jgi:hypothetical protein